MKPRVCVLRTDGTNCDRETAHAFKSSFSLLNADAEIVHINSLTKGYDPVKKEDVSLDDYHILALPGGFANGDYISAGKIEAIELGGLEDDIKKFIEDGKLIIGICNGFQVLVKSGLLPMLNGKIEQTATLTYNNINRYRCDWIRLTSLENRCVWTKGIKSIDLPVAHGEGKFVASEDVIKELFRKDMVVFQYSDDDGNPTMNFPQNPNGSLEGIAGICDETGRIFGLMPHPERYNCKENHHLYTLKKILSKSYVDRSNPEYSERLKIIDDIPDVNGLKIFRNGVNYVIENLLR